MALTLPSVIVLSVDGLENDVTIPGIITSGLQINPEVSAEVTAGSPFPQVVFNRQFRPEFTFSTYCLDKALAAVGLTGLSLKTSEEGKTGLTLYILTTDAMCGRIDPDDVHSVVRLTAGCGFISRISCSSGEDATADLRFISLSEDGVTAEIARTDDVALPAQVAETRFGMGPVQVGAIVLDRLTQISVDFGINAEAVNTDGAVIAKDLMVDTIAPVIEGTTLNTGKFGAETGQIPIGGIAGTNSNSGIFFKKRAAGPTTFVINATAEHIKLSPTGLFQWSEVANSNGNRPQESTFRVTTNQASNGDVPIVISTASAIT